MLTTLFDDVLEPVAACLTPESARRIADLKVNALTQSRLDALADKANEGTLTAEEAAEYDEFLAAFHLISILQARARSVLEQGHAE